MPHIRRDGPNGADQVADFIVDLLQNKL
jgi:hypothetical protein